MNPRWGVRPKPIVRLRTATPTNSLRSLLRLRWTSTRRLQMDSLVRSNLLGELKTKTKINSISSKVVLKNSSFQHCNLKYVTVLNFTLEFGKILHFISGKFRPGKITLAFKIRHLTGVALHGKNFEKCQHNRVDVFYVRQKKKIKIFEVVVIFKLLCNFSDGRKLNSI